MILTKDVEVRISTSNIKSKIFENLHAGDILDNGKIITKNN